MFSNRSMLHNKHSICLRLCRVLRMLAMHRMSCNRTFLHRCKLLWYNRKRNSMLEHLCGNLRLCRMLRIRWLHRVWNYRSICRAYWLCGMQYMVGLTVLQHGYRNLRLYRMLRMCKLHRLWYNSICWMHRVWMLLGNLRLF